MSRKRVLTVRPATRRTGSWGVLPKMIEHGMSACNDTAGDGAGHVPFGLSHGALQIAAQRQVTGYRRRISTAGPVGGNAFDKRRRQQQLGLAVVKNVNCLPATAQMAALHQYRATEARFDLPRGAAHVLHRSDRAADQHSG